MKRILLGCAALALIALPVLTAMPATAAKEGEMCGGIVPLSCNKGLFCEFPAGQCKVVDLQGKCEKVPVVCPEDIVDPVCGCDGKTYSNDCERRAASAQFDHKGACKKKKKE